MRSLLDVNVLIALSDHQHARHEDAHEWWASQRGGWASCAITQNGFVRIMSQPAYPRHVPLPEAVDALAETCSSADHQFWPCDVSLLDPSAVDRRKLLGTKQVTDAYLLALAVARGGRLVSFDTSLPLSAVVGATEEHRRVL